MSAAPAPDTAVVLLNLGGPLRLRDVEPFLYRLFADREIIQFPGPAWLQPLFATLLSKGRRTEVQGRYQEIGGGSPILRQTAAQAAALRRALRAAGRMEPVKIVFRYTAPRAAGMVRALRAQGIRRLLPVTLYPHDCRSTTGSSLSELAREAGAGGLELLPGVLHYATDPRYLDSLSEPLAAALAETPGATVVFSAHSLPVKTIAQGDPYEREINATVAALQARLGPVPGGYRLAYQSKVGPIKWLTPSTETVIHELASRGAQALLVVPVAFVSDHIETLQEIDLLYRDVARAAGIVEFHRAPALNDRPAFIAALAGLVRRHLDAAPHGSTT